MNLPVVRDSFDLVVIHQVLHFLDEPVRALTEAIRNARGLLKPKEDAPVLDDLLEGMTAVIHVRVPEPQFTSQTKDELSTAGITRVVQSLVEAHLKEWVDGRRTKSEAFGLGEDDFAPWRLGATM